jgi:hypothetical protein
MKLEMYKKRKPFIFPCGCIGLVNKDENWENKRVYINS